MATKLVSVEGVGEIQLVKRRGVKSIRLTIRADNVVRVTMPPYVPYQAALAFVQSKREWLASHRNNATIALENGQAIGKKHRLHFISSFTDEIVKTRVRKGLVLVTHPAQLASDEAVVQKAAETACIKALRLEAEELLPSRVAAIAVQTGFHYTSVVIKKLRGRWGSCDNHHNIVLNLHLMQLPWELIDYVILHELVHTEQLHHGPAFWETFLRHQPRAKLLRKEIRQYQPTLLLAAPSKQ